MKILSDIKSSIRFAWGFKNFLKDTLSLADARMILRQSLKEREKNFLTLLENGIYGFPQSPYLHLLKMAHCELGDIQKMVKNEGIEHSLRTLRAAGVYLSLDEFKCRKPIERLGKVISVNMRDFDNPLLSRHIVTWTSRSRGRGTPVLLDLDHLEREAAIHALFISTFDISERPMGLWRPLPPATAGVINILRQAKLGKDVERWFTQNRLTIRPENLKYIFFIKFMTHVSRSTHKALPIPEHIPLDHAEQVARWLHSKRTQGSPAWLDTNVSSGIRICQAAQREQLDINGTLFRFGGEPFTQSKARIVAATGSRAICNYSSSEIGRIGLACGYPQTLDEVHLLSHKLAVIQQAKTVGDEQLDALLLTTLLPSCPRIMLNVEYDDYGQLVERDCGCPLQEFGYHLHLHTIRNFDKLTSEGMQFLASDLLLLIDDILPARFGGDSTDYQFVEEQTKGLTKVSIAISPRIGPVDEPEVVDIILRHLGAKKGELEMMADYWRQGRTIRVVRREPHHTYTGKVLPLHIATKK